MRCDVKRCLMKLERWKGELTREMNAGKYKITIILNKNWQINWIFAYKVSNLNFKFLFINKKLPKASNIIFQCSLQFLKFIIYLSKGRLPFSKLPCTYFWWLVIVNDHFRRCGSTVIKLLENSYFFKSGSKNQPK